MSNLDKLIFGKVAILRKDLKIYLNQTLDMMLEYQLNSTYEEEPKK